MARVIVFCSWASKLKPSTYTGLNSLPRGYSYRESPRDKHPIQEGNGDWKRLEVKLSCMGHYSQTGTKSLPLEQVSQKMLALGKCPLFLISDLLYVVG